MAIPILLDTDIGTDVDDAYALVLAATSPEIDLRAVTTVNHDTELRAKIAKRLLRVLGRDDVPVAVGESQSLTPGESRGWLGIEGQGIDLGEIDPAKAFDRRAAPQLMAELTQRAREEGSPLIIVTIGAMTNLALAIERFPKSLGLAAGVVAMASTFEGYGAGNARSEHNLACDPVAAEKVLRFGLPVKLIGLNVTQQTWMDSRYVETINRIGGPLAESLVGMHRVWLRHIGRESSPMHDGLAVAAVFRPELVSLEPVRAEADVDAGAVTFEADESGQCQVATGVDAAAYHELLYSRVKDAVSMARDRR